jgi:hypothetical protein
MRSAVKRYGSLLGIDPKTAAPEAYHLPEPEISELINTKAPATLAANTRRNLANDIIALLRIGVEQGWLAPLPAPLLSWRQRHPHPRRLGVPGVEGYLPKTSYGLNLDDCPPALRDGLTAYLRWCEAPIARDRDRRIVKRPISNRHVQDSLLRIAGFAVQHLHQPIETLTLEGICHPDVMEAYANRWIETRGKMTSGLDKAFRNVTALANHWLKDPELANNLLRLHRSLPAIEPVRQKERHWLSLQQLEEIGLSTHPKNPRRVQEYPYLRWPCYWAKRDQSRNVLRVGMSLMIRLLIRLPMRQRCLREMLLDKNLYRDHAGVWQVRFIGTELKVARVKGTIGRYEFPFPGDLVPLLDEYLTEWRPLIAPPDEPHVFLNARGKPFTDAGAFSNLFSRATYRFSGGHC